MLYHLSPGRPPPAAGPRHLPSGVSSGALLHLCGFTLRSQEPTSRSKPRKRLPGEASRRMRSPGAARPLVSAELAPRRKSAAARPLVSAELAPRRKSAVARPLVSAELAPRRKSAAALGARRLRTRSRSGFPDLVNSYLQSFSLLPPFLPL